MRQGVSAPAQAHAAANCSCLARHRHQARPRTRPPTCLHRHSLWPSDCAQRTTQVHGSAAPSPTPARSVAALHRSQLSAAPAGQRPSSTRTGRSSWRARAGFSHATCPTILCHSALFFVASRRVVEPYCVRCCQAVHMQRGPAHRCLPSPCSCPRAPVVKLLVAPVSFVRVAARSHTGGRRQSESVLDENGPTGLPIFAAHALQN
jgi:hypothetical protein